jgi:hypothetical protein
MNQDDMNQELRRWLDAAVEEISNVLCRIDYGGSSEARWRESQGVVHLRVIAGDFKQTTSIQIADLRDMRRIGCDIPELVLRNFVTGVLTETRKPNGGGNE